MKNKIVFWVAKLLVVVILGQTLFFKFAGAPESIYIFSKVGIEPDGRIASGVLEIIASILILIPRTTLLGALLALVTMLAALSAHFFVLGIEVQNDSGILFVLAIITALTSLYLIVHERNKFSDLLKFKI